MNKHRRIPRTDTTTILALLHDTCAEGYLRRQLAEECAELNVAALKCIRSDNGETPADPKLVYDNYLEELADVSVMLDLALAELPSIDAGRVDAVKNQKQTRMLSRLRHTQRERRSKASAAYKADSARVARSTREDDQVITRQGKPVTASPVAFEKHSGAGTPDDELEQILNCEDTAPPLFATQPVVHYGDDTGKTSFR